jgi:hypothetical protein
VFRRVKAAISSCKDPERLQKWILAAPDLSDAEFLQAIKSPR